MFFTIITPTIGHPLLKRLLEKLNEQTFLSKYPTTDENPFAIEHLIVIDGKNEFGEKTKIILDQVPTHSKISRQVFELPFNTGKEYLGHKIYPAITNLMRGEYVLFLDDDNFYFENHLQNYFEKIQHKKYQWLFSLRKIFYENQEVCEDNCESLGHISSTFNHPGHFMIDTNCYCIRKDIALESVHIQNKIVTPYLDSPDRSYAKYLLMNYPDFISTYEYTVAYEVYENKQQVKKEFFLYRNEIMKQKFGETYPWMCKDLNLKKNIVKKEIYVLHFDLGQTNEIIQRFYRKSKDEKNNKSIAFNDWQLNILDQLDPNLFYLKNGYQFHIPSNSIVLCHMCIPTNLPAFVLERKDLIKILYTIESPNIRHQIQWSKDFLEKYFTHVITYWKDLEKLNTSLKIFNFPFCHRLNFSLSCDQNLLQSNRDNIDNPSTCIVLENRPFDHLYKINETILQSQDYLREKYACQISNMHCYGKGWDSLKERENLYVYHKNLEFNRMHDTFQTKDYYQKHTFSLIIENCNAEGYVSEKIYDAWMVNSIPLYYGNFTNELKEKLGIDENLYIDLKKYTPEEIANKLKNITKDEILQYQNNIEKKKKDIY